MGAQRGYTLSEVSTAPLHARLTWRAKCRARGVVARLARPTYRRSLDYLTGREELPRLLNERGLVGVGVEVGVKEGSYSELLLERWRGQTLVSVDPWSAAVDPNGDHGGSDQAAIDALYERTRDRLRRFGPRSRILRKASVEAARDFNPASLDFVYLDAGHDLASVRADLLAWAPLVRPGGILAGHDYLDGPVSEATFRVKSAVDEFAVREGLRVGVTLRDAPLRSWFIAIPKRSA